MADRWAAASMMAGHPNNATPFSLANTPFAIHMGALDSAYDRNLRAQEWGDALDALEQTYPGLYTHSVNIHDGLGHWMNLEDAVALPWMHAFDRDPIPRRVHWEQTNRRRTHFYWLSMPQELTSAEERISVEYDPVESSVDILENYASELSIWLNDDMLNLDEQVSVKFEGNEIYSGSVVRNISNTYSSVGQHGDKNTTFSARLTVNDNSSVSF